MSDAASEKRIVGIHALARFLTENDYPIAYSTLAKLCMPSVDKGPRRDGMWGKHPIFRPGQSLEWARERSGMNTS